MSDKKPEGFSLSKFLQEHPGLSDMPVETPQAPAQSRVVEGVLVNDQSKTVPSDLLGYPTLDVENWLAFMDSSPAGFDPVLRDFLKANPASISIDGTTDIHADRIGQSEGGPRVGVANARAWTKLSDVAKSANAGSSHAEAGKDWALPLHVAEAVVGSDLANSIINFAKDLGINVVTEVGAKRQPISSAVLEFANAPTDYSSSSASDHKIPSPEAFARAGKIAGAAKGATEKPRRLDKPGSDEPSL